MTGIGTGCVLLEKELDMAGHMENWMDKVHKL